jgi:hypothetical protein
MNKQTFSAAIVAILSLGLAANAQAADWTPASGGAFPADALVAGQEADKPLAICHAQVRGGAVYPGYIGPNYTGCKIGAGGKETTVASYEVYTGTASKWVAGADGAMPATAVAGGQSGAEIYYLCRTSYRGGIYPGKISTATKACNFPYQGQEIGVMNYEVLSK